MKPDTITSREGTLRQYRCRGEHAAGRCPAPTSVLAHVIEPRVVAAFFAELGPDGVLTRPAADRAAGLPALWPDLSTQDRRQQLAAGIDAIMLRRGRDIATRTLILWAGEAPDDLPARGRRVALASFAWPERAA
jgi:hypothetical protein